MLVAAGEAKPEDANWSGEARREEWVVLAGMDAEGLRREMLKETFLQDPPRSGRGKKMGETDKKKLREKAIEAQTRFWMRRVMVQRDVKLFESHQALAMLSSFARQYPEYFLRVFHLPFWWCPLLGAEFLLLSRLQARCWCRQTSPCRCLRNALLDRPRN